MCTVLLPPGVNPIAVNQCIVIYLCEESGRCTIRMSDQTPHKDAW